MKKTIESDHLDYYNDLFPPTQLLPNPELASLIDNSFDYSPSWPIIVDSFRSLNQDGKTRYDERAIMSMLGEICIRESMRNAYRDNPRFDFNPILNGQTNDHFNFKRNFHRTFEALSNLSKQIVAEYDDIFTFDGVPTIVELKIESNINNVKKSLRQEHIRIATLPLQEHFETNKIHYMLIIPPEYIVDSDKTGKYDEFYIPGKRFESSGGTIIPFFSSHDDFKAEVEDIIEEYNL